jgi:hypothetical protein
VFVPSDQQVDLAAWAGRTVANGPFRRAVMSLAQAVHRSARE